MISDQRWTRLWKSHEGGSKVEGKRHLREHIMDLLECYLTVKQRLSVPHWTTLCYGVAHFILMCRILGVRGWRHMLDAGVNATAYVRLDSGELKRVQLICVRASTYGEAPTLMMSNPHDTQDLTPVALLQWFRDEKLVTQTGSPRIADSWARIFVEDHGAADKSLIRLDALYPKKFRDAICTSDKEMMEQWCFMLVRCAASWGSFDPSTVMQRMGWDSTWQADVLLSHGPSFNPLRTVSEADKLFLTATDLATIMSQQQTLATTALPASASASASTSSPRSRNKKASASRFDDTALSWSFMRIQRVDPRALVPDGVVVILSTPSNPSVEGTRVYFDESLQQLVDAVSRHPLLPRYAFKDAMEAEREVALDDNVTLSNKQPSVVRVVPSFAACATPTVSRPPRPAPLCVPDSPTSPHLEPLRSPLDSPGCSNNSAASAATRSPWPSASAATSASGSPVASPQVLAKRPLQWDTLKTMLAKGVKRSADGDGSWGWEFLVRQAGDHATSWMPWDTVRHQIARDQISLLPLYSDVQEDAPPAKRSRQSVSLVVVL